MSQLHDLTALEQASAIRSGEVSSVELTTHYLERIERLNDAVGAFTTITGESAIDAARVADAEARGDGGRSVLHGVPVGIKDLNSIAGVRTTFGSAAFADFVAPETDTIVQRILDAGMVSLGKTQTPEFGFPCWTINEVGPTSKTPWDLSRLASGSSGGAASAVAAGLLPIAQGSDGGGSVRSPASACGLVGLKPSRGRTSAGPTRYDTSGLGVVGPLAWTVRDAAAFLDLTAGPDASDAVWAPPPPTTFLDACNATPGRLRIGRYVDPVVPGAVVADDVRTAWERTSALLESLGHEVVDIEAPISADEVEEFMKVWALGATGLPVTPEQRERLQPLTRWLGDRGQSLSGPEAMAALTAMGLAGKQVLRRLAPYDVVLCPVTTDVARPLDWYDAEPAEDFERQKRYSAFTSVYNVSGQPAISLPLETDRDGLPIGMMLVGRPCGEPVLLALSAQLEQARPWRDRRPALWT